MLSNIKTTINSCARCGNAHADIVFVSFGNPVGVYTHWVLCPVVNEPILLVNGDSSESIMAKEMIANMGMDISEFTKLVKYWPQPYDAGATMVIGWLADKVGDPDLKIEAARLMDRTMHSCLFYKVVEDRKSRVFGQPVAEVKDVLDLPGEE